MDQGIDTSIYGQLQTPQPANLLGMGMQGAYMANAMNQNRMFQVQMQARVGLADIAQHHANPDGSVDYEGILSDMFKDPRTAMMAPQWGQAMAQQGLLNMETLNERQKLWESQINDMYASLAPIFPKIQAGTAVQSDAIDALARGLTSGLYTTAQAANLITMMPPDKKDASGNVVGNPELNQHLWGLVQAWKGSRDAWNNFTGTIQSFPTPQGTEVGTYSPGTGQYTHLGQAGFGTPYESKDVTGQTTPIPQNQIPGMGGSLWQPGGGGGGNPQGYTAGQNPGVAPGQVSSQGLAPPPGPNTNPGDVDRAVLMLGQRESGLQNIQNRQGGDAFGYFQIRPQTWQDGLRLAGLPANVDLHSASFDQQFQVAKALYLHYGEQPWLASHGMSGPLPQGQMQPQQGQVAQAGSPSSGAVNPQAAADLQQEIAQQPPVQGATPLTGTAQSQQAPAQGQGQPAQPGYTFTPQEQQALGMTPGKKVVSGLPPLISDYQNGKGTLHDYEQEYQATQASDNQANLSMNEMGRLLAEFKAGRGETAFSEIARVAQTLGMDKDLVSSIGRGDLDAIQEFQKLAVPNAVNVARVTEGPNSKLTNMISGAFLATQPNLEMTPGAITRMFNFMGKIQQLHNLTYQAWTEERSRMQAAAAQNGAWTPQMQARLQNFPAAFEQGLINSGVLNFDFNTPKLVIEVGPPKGQP